MIILFIALLHAIPVFAAARTGRESLVGSAAFISAAITLVADEPGHIVVGLISVLLSYLVSLAAINRAEEMPALVRRLPLIGRSRPVSHWLSGVPVVALCAAWLMHPGSDTAITRPASASAMQSAPGPEAGASATPPGRDSFTRAFATQGSSREHKRDFRQCLGLPKDGTPSHCTGKARISVR